MDSTLQREFERLTLNAAMRREDLLISGLNRSRNKKLLTILAGVLALTSAATIAAFITKLYGSDGMQTASAIVALASGTISLVVTSYYSDDEIVGRLAGSSKYLALRDVVFRLATDPDSTDKQKRKSLVALQLEYSNLDSAYSKYFTRGVDPTKETSLDPMFAAAGPKVAAAAQRDFYELRRSIENVSHGAAD